MKKILILSFLIFPLSSIARSPAVEPVSGISIDHYEKVEPSKARGFDWRQDTSKSESSPINTEKLAQDDLTISNSPDLTPAITLLLALVLPFGIWFTLSGKLKTTQSESKETFEEVLDNTLPFKSKKERDSISEDDDDDFNIPKAS